MPMMLGVSLCCNLGRSVHWILETNAFSEVSLACKVPSRFIFKRWRWGLGDVPDGVAFLHLGDGFGSNSPPCNLVLLWVFLIFLPSSVNREMFSHRYWLSNLRCNPSLFRHNQQNKAATMICPLISWSDSNLQAPGLSDSCI
ncbi:hypothetical protein VPH35_077492 [Triticum aestivum]|uniref:uncharacterized protein isoform X1 n=2 Tax=Triticum aestivum TaxID=4565 RepID=UPI001D01F285|nr:uncharacterized protein LOC123096640 isoform X1 [Triticum aestivum]XP_044374338.1 uncharacterized protein LOC123096640 isoform X1 [Triticum aestivum]